MKSLFVINPTTRKWHIPLVAGLSVGIPMVIGIIFLQIIVEFLIVRNYTIAVIFITILTIFLAESGNELSHNTNEVFLARLVYILIISAIGIVGGWILYHEKVHFYAKLQINKLSKNEKSKS